MARPASEARVEKAPYPMRDSRYPPWQRWAIVTLRWGIMVAIALGVGQRIWREKANLAAYDLWLAPGWLVTSGLCYLVGLATCAVFWRAALRDLGGQARWMTTMAAYYAGHVGKYVPGKGLAIVLRASLVHGPGVGISQAAITSVHETVLMMATGAVVALFILPLVTTPHHRYLLIISAVLAVGLGLFALPPVVSRLGRLATQRFPKAANYDGRPCRWRTLAVGVTIIAVGWLLMGLSLAAVLAAMHRLGDLTVQSGPLKVLGLLTVVVALATVGGFVTLTPAGLGTREWILVETLGPVLGSNHAIVAAGMLRIVWIVAEVTAAGLFLIADRQWNQHQAYPH